ncbi:DUF1465 family protein [Chelatococcus sp. SYSU_G07232]|uniref:DUF1465 family protein n=1 Tax=Chelatococcus albus TaxID=3047466 RepID=A0ABT7AFW2_9HYPH|nr:DUF1465 family protein [Chelatococcus sp. SYSU_G07232]MDJ1158268.1 DUF1465 family protein [Chelatococcus sp. SYSU_G07232]
MTEPTMLPAAQRVTPISFGQSFVSSESFRLLFREGMGLIEETAAYLDGQGRDDSRGLVRQGSLAYATESMRLTTRLMQIASWLLVQRAVAEGEMTPEQARQEQNKVKLTWQDQTSAPELFALLPVKLQDLIGHSLRLQTRIMHLDALIAGAAAPVEEPGDSPVAQQLGLLRSAFGR